MNWNDPIFECPRFAKCNVPDCPLSSDYGNIYTDPRDDNKKCTLSKTKRKELASKSSVKLRHGGLTKREYAGKNNWNNLPEERKAEIIERGKKSQFTPVSQIQKQTGIVEEAGCKNV